MKVNDKNTDPTSFKAYKALIIAGDDKADKKAAANLLEKQEKNILARLASSLNEGSEAARKRFAEGSPEYMEHMRITTEARKEADKATVKYDALQVGVQLKLDESATARLAMKLEGELT